MSTPGEHLVGVKWKRVGATSVQDSSPLEKPNVTDRLSSNGPGRQHPDHPDTAVLLMPPCLLPFDLHGEPDADAPLPGGPRSDEEDGDDEPSPAAPASAALVIRCPVGQQLMQPGFTIAAVEMGTDEDGAENPLSFAYLTGQPLHTQRVAVGLAVYKATEPRKLPIPATHILVNDETGREVFRRAVLRVA